MKHITFSILIFSFFFAVIPLKAQNTIQFMLRNSMTESDLTFPQTWFFLTHKAENKSIGFNGYAYVAEGWGECYGGISFYPLPPSSSTLLTFAIYGGVETAKGYWRSAIDGLFVKNNFSAYGIYEYGAGGNNDDYLYFCFGYKAKSWLKPEIKISRFGPNWKSGAGTIFFFPKTPVSIEPVIHYNYASKKPEADLSAYLDF